MNDLLYTQRLHDRLRWFHFNSGERKLPSENLTAAEQFCKVKKGALLPCSLSKQVRFSPAVRGRGKNLLTSHAEKLLRALPRHPASAQRSRLRSRSETTLFLCTFSFLKLDREAAFCADSHYVSFERSCIVPLGKIRCTVVPFPSIENAEIPSPILSHSRLLR